MASVLNDKLVAFTSSGSVNLYDDQACIGSSATKAMAAALGGHNYNIVNNLKGEDSSVFFPYLRNPAHFVDDKNNATKHMWTRKRRVETAPQDARTMLVSPDGGLSEKIEKEHRIVTNFAQARNHDNFAGFQADTEMIRKGKRLPESQPSKSPSIVPEKAWSKMPITKPKTQSSSSATLQWQQDTYGDKGGPHYSRNRLSVTNLNVTKQSIRNGDDKLSRNDPFYVRPRLANHANSVTYDVISNQTREFAYNTRR